jgi:hypothetical protein
MYGTLLASPSTAHAYPPIWRRFVQPSAANQGLQIWVFCAPPPSWRLTPNGRSTSILIRLIRHQAVRGCFELLASRRVPLSRAMNATAFTASVWPVRGVVFVAGYQLLAISLDFSSGGAAGVCGNACPEVTAQPRKCGNAGLIWCLQ